MQMDKAPKAWQLGMATWYRKVATCWLLVCEPLTQRWVDTGHLSKNLLSKNMAGTRNWLRNSLQIKHQLTRIAGHNFPKQILSRANREKRLKKYHLERWEAAELNSESVLFQDTIAREKRMAWKITSRQIAFVKQETHQDVKKKTQN